MPSSDNKRIAKNTLFLYLRTLISILVNLYTVKLLWEILGIDNYGIFNVVGGLVTMFAFLNNAMVASSQRFISFELGRGNKERLQKTFSISLIVHFLLAICVLIIAESVGLWFLNYKLNIPEGRMIAANWVYQCSVMSFLLQIISVPYNACIVAHEHMKVYGYLGILDVILKLILVLLCAVIPFDKLIVYSLFILLLAVFNRFIYYIYSKKHFEECKFIKTKDSHLMKDMFSFAGWSFIGNMGTSVRTQGVNIVLNLFFNVAVNAAKGVATQIGVAINSFASSFIMAINPQITKRYASGKFNEMLQLLIEGCKFSFLLMSIIIIPVLICANALLELWLDDVAPYTVGFLQLFLIMALVDCVINPITTALQATGKIKKFQITVSILMISVIPISWLWLKFDLNPFIVMFVSIFASIAVLLTQLVILKEQISFSLKHFLIKVYSRSLPYFFVNGFINWFIYRYYNNNLIGTLSFGFTSLIISIVLIFFFVLKRNERNLILNRVLSFKSKLIVKTNKINK